MKRLLFTLLCFSLVSGQLRAASVDVATAKRAGEGFVGTALQVSHRSCELQLVTVEDQYYVFNVGNEGFVIVSSDDRFRPIIGYSDEGAFPMEDPSPEMMYYLGSIARNRQAALRANMQPDPLASEEWTALLQNENLPSRNGNKGSFYLVQTRWNQSDPYNKFCPTDDGGRAYAGCVATAMSQVMNYWRHPTHGQGQHSYSLWGSGTLSVDFSAAEYHFELMPNSIYSGSPVENIDAIAEFMYHCGVAVDMSYSSDGSGAFSEDVPDAALKYFGYTNRCRYTDRDNYSLEEFQRLLKDQFDMGWPCYYSGQDTGGQGGHAFVCDGYDDFDLFHFNWGWGGSGDGFFAIDELNVSSYAFNDYQGVIYNFVPPVVFEHPVKAPDFFTAVPNGDDDFSVTLSWTNPTATLAGNVLESMDQIVILRNGEVVHTIDNPTPGAAMTYVDVAGLPVMVNYAVYAVNQGYGGRKSRADGINLGPVCDWTFALSCTNANGWGNGELSLLNSSGVMVSSFKAEKSNGIYTIGIPQGKITFNWKAPSEGVDIGIDISDSEGQPVFSYQGASTEMPQGIFFETVNTCGGSGRDDHPQELIASIDGEDVILNWTGIQNVGYGYNIYRDGNLYTMVPATTDFTDQGAATEAHEYYVTAFCKEGETDPTNVVSTASDPEGMAPQNLTYEILANGKVKLSWEAPENRLEFSGYRVFRKADGDAYKTIKTLSASSLSYTDNANVASGHRYYYRVCALYDHGDVTSAPASLAGSPDLRFVEVNRTHLPSNLTLEDLGANQMLLQWDPAFLAESYNLYRNGELIAQGLTETQFTDAYQGAESSLVYRVTGVLNGVESSPSNRACWGNVAVPENESSETSLFPNPSKGQVIVRAEELQTITVYQMTGQQVMRFQVSGDRAEIDLSTLTPGVYYLNICTSKGNRIQKVVLTK